MKADDQNYTTLADAEKMARKGVADEIKQAIYETLNAWIEKTCHSLGIDPGESPAKSISDAGITIAAAHQVKAKNCIRYLNILINDNKKISDYFLITVITSLSETQVDNKVLERAPEDKEYIGQQELAQRLEMID